MVCSVAEIKRNYCNCMDLQKPNSVLASTSDSIYANPAQSHMWMSATSVRLRSRFFVTGVEFWLGNGVWSMCGSSLLCALHKFFQSVLGPCLYLVPNS
uniref:Ovule protein n=1 Tax=Syphacia muris TaxID=451379 RepID=A0A0N5AWT3_9BILA